MKRYFAVFKLVSQNNRASRGLRLIKIVLSFSLFNALHNASHRVTSLFSNIIVSFLASITHLTSSS